MKKEIKAYTYLIGWSKLDKWYYGVRYAKECNSKELFVSYFTSSKYVKYFILENGNPDVIQIRKLFDDPIKAVFMGTKSLKEIRCRK